MSEVGHLTEVKHGVSGFCFVCDDIDCNVSRSFSPILSVSEPFSLNVWQMIALASLGLSMGFFVAIKLSLILWG